jgi:GNAT superfamily N-acetyltransferase
MKIRIREWYRDDLPQIQILWLEYCRKVARSDMRLTADAEIAMKGWLSERFRQPRSIGLVAHDADDDATVLGFAIGRVDDWESAPPIIESRRIGIVDAVYVVDEHRRKRIGAQLIDQIVEKMRSKNAVAVETIYDAWNDAAAAAWHRAGFAPWMVHAYRML